MSFLDTLGQTTRFRGLFCCGVFRRGSYLDFADEGFVIDRMGVARWRLSQHFQSQARHILDKAAQVVPIYGYFMSNETKQQGLSLAIVVMLRVEEMSPRQYPASSTRRFDDNGSSVLID